MQKVILVTLIFLFASCATYQERSTIKMGICIYENVKDGAVYYKNPPITITLKECYRNWGIKREKAVALYHRKFKEKYGQELLGMSNYKQKVGYLIDSNPFVSDSRCVETIGTPVTKKRIKIDKPESFVIEYE